MNIATSIARAIGETDAGAFDSVVIEKAKTCLRDMIGIACQAADLPASRQAVQFAAMMGGSQGTLIGSA